MTTWSREQINGIVATNDRARGNAMTTTETRDLILGVVAARIDMARSPIERAAYERLWARLARDEPLRRPPTEVVILPFQAVERPADGRPGPTGRCGETRNAIGRLWPSTCATLRGLGRPVLFLALRHDLERGVGQWPLQLERLGHFFF
jgi:hypothetical protein